MRIALNIKRTLIVLVGVLILITGYIYFVTPKQIVYHSYQWVIDPSDDSKLVGWAENVFIGKVNSQTGNKTRIGTPETQFSVEVLDNIKGKLDGTITVNQQGGIEQGKLYLFENDKMLEVGKTYLFITRYSKEENWHTLVPSYGDILIQDEMQKKSLMDRFINAHRTQIPFTSNQ